MVAARRSLITLLSVVALLCLAVTVSAQDGTAGALTVGQPVIAQLSAEAPTARFSYIAEEPQQATLQAFGETAQPKISVLRNGEIIASEANATGAVIVNLPVLLSGGAYTIEVGAANGTSGAVIIVLQNVAPVPVTDLTPGSIVDAEVNAASPIALFRVPASAEASYLYIESGLQTGGPLVSLINEATGATSGTLNTDLLGGRFNLAADTTYRVDVTHSGQNGAEPVTVCWVAVGAEGCGSAPAPVATEEATEVETEPVAVQSTGCIVTPAGGAVNVRASASIEAPIIASLASGVSANVVGVAPGGFFYNIQLGAVNGWVAASVVNVSGDCASVPTVQPPAFQPIATQVPAQPQPQPTQAPEQPQQPQQPEQPPQNSGPCLLTINSPVNVYTQPTAQVDFLQDQVQAGELIPTGRLADNSWWQTNYGGAWVQTGLIGGALTQSGNCNLPVVQPPQPPQQNNAPCLLTVVGNVNVYTQPQSGNAFLLDVVAPGGELIPNGRLADNSWYRTNYAGGWVPTAVIGSGLEVSGNCGNLPVVTP